MEAAQMLARLDAHDAALAEAEPITDLRQY